MSYQDNGDENGAGSEGESYQGGDSEEEFSDAPPAKKKKTSAKKKMKKAKKEKKKSKHTDDSDEDDIVAEVRFIHLFLPHMSQSLSPVKKLPFFRNETFIFKGGNQGRVQVHTSSIMMKKHCF